MSIPAVISIVALAVSLFTLWLTQLRRGRLVVAPTEAVGWPSVTNGGSVVRSVSDTMKMEVEVRPHADIQLTRVPRPARG